MVLNCLPHDEFDNLVLTYCKRETSQIDFILTTTIDITKGILTPTSFVIQVAILCMIVY